MGPSAPELVAWERRCHSRLWVLLLIGSLALSGCGQSHSGGDPGGVVYRELRPVLKAVPPGVTNIHAQSNDASWQATTCPGNGKARPGWSQVFVGATFVTQRAKVVVLASINRVLAHEGWVRDDIVVTQGQGPVAHWARRVGTGRRADAFAFAVPNGSEHWYLTASWEPPGFELPGC
jgi:hypothetical protein